MRALGRPIRHFRWAFQQQRYEKRSISIDSGFAHKLTNGVETRRFRDPAFALSRALSVEAVKVANGGFVFGFLYFLYIMKWVCFIIEARLLLLSHFCLLMADTNRAGPLVEYERRISSGELVDGDTCQVW